MQAGAPTWKGWPRPRRVTVQAPVQPEESRDGYGEPSLTFAPVAGPTHGTLSAPTGNGAVRTYTPTPGYFGPDKITFTASDGHLPSAIGTVQSAVRDAMPASWTRGSSVMRRSRARAAKSVSPMLRR